MIIWLIYYAYLTAPQTTKLKKINNQDYSKHFHLIVTIRDSDFDWDS